MFSRKPAGEALKPAEDLMLLALLVASLSPTAQLPVLPFPLQRVAQSSSADAAGIEVYEPIVTELAALRSHDRLNMTAVPVADGDTVSVELERIRLDRLNFGFQVNGQSAPGLLEGLELSVWRGQVVGSPGDDVVLSFSTRGVRGWLRHNGELSHLMPSADDNGDWARSTVRVVAQSELSTLGLENGFSCQTEQLPQATDPFAPIGELAPAEERFTAPTTAQGQAGSCLLRSCAVAVETDWQHHQLFGGSLSAQTAYITSLLAVISSLYEQEIETVLTFPYVQFYTNPTDPWTTADSGFASSLTYLFELQAAWTGNIPGGARIGHLLSGGFLDGGIAYLDVLCEQTETFAFGVTANQDGSASFPLTQTPFNWDFTATTHEIGHNFGAVHTHDWQPVIDNCAGGACGADGTIMSYCHLCPGGTANIQLGFDSAVQDYLLGEIVHCLPLDTGVLVEPPLAWDPIGPTPVTAQVAGTPVGSIDLSWRLNPLDSFQTTAMVSAGAGQWTADLPAAACGSTPEFFVSFTDSTCGLASTPTFTPPVASVEIVFADTFETDLGWLTSAPGDTASDGIWTRIDPNGTYAQPYEDHTPAGTLAYITGQHSSGDASTSDVDGGKTTLVSPIIDLSDGDAVVRYERWYHNIAAVAPGLDFFQVDVSNNGGLNWTNVETVGPFGVDATGGWYTSEFLVSDVITPTNQVRVRFVAKDSFDTTVEAGIDDFFVYRLGCTTCQEDLGFQGPGDLALSWCGDPLGTNGSSDLVLENATPGTPAWIAFSVSNNPFPFFGGTVVTVPVTVLIPGTANAGGEFSLLGLTSNLTGITLYAQGAAIDLGQAEMLEISNAVKAVFLP